MFPEGAGGDSDREKERTEGAEREVLLRLDKKKTPSGTRTHKNNGEKEAQTKLISENIATDRRGSQKCLSLNSKWFRKKLGVGTQS